MRTPVRILALLIIFIITAAKYSNAQLPYNLADGRDHRFCQSCQQMLQAAPREVLFGLQVNEDGEIYFSMSDRQWFEKIFKNDSYGVAIDIVSKDRYVCAKENKDRSILPKGIILKPVYRKELLKENDELISGKIFTKIGSLPASLKNKTVEGNLIILNGNYICHYTNFINIDRSAWKLLPMGLFTDSLINNSPAGDVSQAHFFTYSRKIRLEIPFQKSSANFSDAELKRISDSLSLKDQVIRKIEIRAYSSVEGAENTNKALMKKRADAMLKALKPYQSGVLRSTVLSAENWLDFFEDIKETKFEELADLSKTMIKQKLADPALAKEMEPLLAKERKVITTLFVEDRSAVASAEDKSLLSDFNDAIVAKNIIQARLIQKELVERISDKKLPVDFLNKLEVPQTKDFSSILNDREVFKYLLKATSEYEALDNFLQLKKLDPENGRINYNICALQFFMWQFGGDTTASKTLLKDIRQLSRQGIHHSLVKRMMINYHILLSETQMSRFDYAAKDTSLNFIHRIYSEITATDDEIYSLAKYYTYYSHSEWAEEIILPRVDKLDASEDLVFYYVNLLFYQPGEYDSDIFRKALLNAVNLNSNRFCRFFLPNDKGGANMQLLDYDNFKTMYCETCK